MSAGSPSRIAEAAPASQSIRHARRAQGDVIGEQEARAADNLLALSEKKQQFRLVRRAGYAALSILVLVLTLVVWTVSGGTLDPLVIPLPALMFVILLGALLLNVTAVAFGAFEVQAASGGEQRYLIAKHGYSTGLVTAGFAVFFFVMIAALGPLIDSQIDYDKNIELGLRSQDGVITAPFNVTSDFTGSSYLAWVEVNSVDASTSNNGGLFNVSVYQHDDWAWGNNSWRANHAILTATNVTTFRLTLVRGAGEPPKIETVPSGNWSFPARWQFLQTAPESDKYYIVIERRELTVATINYHQDRQLDPGFVNSVYVLLVGLVAVNAGAAGYNYFVRKKWRAYGEKNY